MPLQYDKISFIKEVEKHPVLWDVHHKKYNDRFCMAVAWKDISFKLHTPENILKTKWKNLRDIFKREIRKYCHTTKLYTGQWKFFKKMSFLKENYLKEEEENNREEKDDVYPIEFVVETDSEDQNSDEISGIDNASHRNYINREQRSFINVSKLSKIRHSDNKTLNGEEESQTFSEIYESDSYNNEHNVERTNIEDNSSEYFIPAKRKRLNNISNDVMFLKSLAPYFSQLEPLRKLVIRSKIQDLLLKEISEQNASELN